MLRLSITLSTLYGLAFALATLAFLASPTEAYIVGLSIAALCLCVSASATSHLWWRELQRLLTRAPKPPRPATLIDAPLAMSDPRTVAFNAGGVAQPPLRLEPISPTINRELAAFIQHSIDALNERGERGADGIRFLTSVQYRERGVSDTRRQLLMGLLGRYVATQPYGRVVVGTLGELKQRVERGEIG